MKGSVYSFGGCSIIAHDHDEISMQMDSYWKRVNTIRIPRLRRKMATAMETADEISRYRSLAGTLLYLGNGVSLQASLVVSQTQQRIGRRSVGHFIDANETVRNFAET